MVGTFSIKITFKSGSVLPEVCGLSPNFQMAPAHKIQMENAMLLHW